MATSAEEEVAKAAARNLELTEEEVALEEARERFHANRRDRAARQDFREAQARVRRIRYAKRLVREAEGPPPGVDVVTDAGGNAIGWHDHGNAVVRAPAPTPPGGAA